MPPQHERKPGSPPRKTIEQIIDEQGLYPREAFEFVRRGLSFTVEKVHRELTDPEASRHVSGQQLCEGLREFALARWGLMARVVLNNWNIRRTEDFGKIVFTLVEHEEMAKTDEDTPDDFRRVYDFKQAFEADFKIDEQAVRKGIESRS